MRSGIYVSDDSDGVLNNSDGAEAVEVRAYSSAAGVRASDHRPVFAHLHVHLVPPGPASDPAAAPLRAPTPVSAACVVA